MCFRERHVVGYVTVLSQIRVLIMQQFQIEVGSKCQEILCSSFYLYNKLFKNLVRVIKYLAHRMLPVKNLKVSDENGDTMRRIVLLPNVCKAKRGVYCHNFI